MQVLLKWIGCQWQRGCDLMMGVTAIETGASKPDGVTGAAEDPKVLTTQCIEAFRRAAGAAQYLADTLLPRAIEELEEDNKKLSE